MAVFVFLLFLFICVWLGLYLVFMIDLVFVGHDFATTKLAVTKVGQIVENYGKSGGVLYDFGSCRGDFALRLARRCPQLHIYGIDNSGLRVCWSRFRGYLRNGLVKFNKADIFSVNISEADVVYVYLKQSVMPKLEKKLRQELKTGAIAIVNTQYFPFWPSAQTHIVHSKKPDYEKLFVYQQV